jgi:hypothetical protein
MGRINFLIPADAQNTASYVARRSTIAEQNLIIGSVYSSLLDARESLESRDQQSALRDIKSAIEDIENYRQKRDPEHGAAT